MNFRKLFAVLVALATSGITLSLLSTAIEVEARAAALN